MRKKIFSLGGILITVLSLSAQNNNMKPEYTEYYEPVPRKVTPGANAGEAPSDAVVLFDGKSLDQWISVSDTTKPAGWKVANGIVTVDKKMGDIRTKQRFNDFQLHIEFLIPDYITGSGQARGNSGVFLAANEGGAEYELQVLDNYENKTYVNGQAGSIYKQKPPLVNANKKPGEWQYYDVVWTAPRFNADGMLITPARITVLFNGVLVQNNFELKGNTPYIGLPVYKAHGPSPIKLQSHGDPSEPISYRNIWVRPL
ncbi:3-keto-disaccharide hydrolase [Foetidibacter luteolus]|uniref:3-keto-disaccharide hydrolase n=1 Tax=Foetidibacter luteolus TaxID=2608880 RepID=UPI00129A7813|nr:DUF1080 domain-containing protein [Foetidibacter luteolus]